jgi:hypothetical protein
MQRKLAAPLELPTEAGEEGQPNECSSSRPRRAMRSLNCRLPAKLNSEGTLRGFSSSRCQVFYQLCSTGPGSRVNIISLESTKNIRRNLALRVINQRKVRDFNTSSSSHITCSKQQAFHAIAPGGIYHLKDSLGCFL